MTQDDKRRDEIVRLTLQGIGEDLEDVRADLAAQFEDYEQRLANLTTGLPEWLEVDPAQLRALYGYTWADISLRLGPRAVAEAADRVVAAMKRFAEAPDVAALEGERAAILKILGGIESGARDCALTADNQLAEMLDAILADLEERRASDETALRDLVNTGEVDKGRDAREEIAALWEEQRGRASSIRHTWEPLEGLVFEGVDATVAGIAELRDLVHRAAEGLGGAPADKPPFMEVEDMPRVTERLQPATGTDEWDREVATFEADHPGQPVDAEESPWGATDPDVGPTSKVDVTTLAKRDAKGKTRQPPPSTHAATPTKPPRAAARDAESALDTSPPAAVRVAKADDSSTFEHDTHGTVTRRTQGWLRVPWSERVLVSLPPVVLLGLAASATIPRLTGAVPAFDVHQRLVWLFPWGTAVILTLWVGLLLARKWRIRWWEGPELVHYAEREESSPIVVDRHGVKIAEVRYPARQLAAKVCRWEVTSDGTFGYQVELRPRTSAPVYLTTVERNFTRWDESGEPLASRHEQAWLTSPQVLEAVRQRLGVA